VQQLHREACAVERWNRMHPDQPEQTPWISQCLTNAEATYVVTSDYHRALTGTLARWFPARPVILGPDGFGRSESRSALRRHFEVNAAHIACGALSDLARRGLVPLELATEARRDLQINADQPDPATC
jgi:pyruvate dehydrogenase E1 component